MINPQIFYPGIYRILTKPYKYNCSRKYYCSDNYYKNDVGYLIVVYSLTLKQIQIINFYSSIFDKISNLFFKYGDPTRYNILVDENDDVFFLKKESLTSLNFNLSILPELEKQMTEHCEDSSKLL